MRLLRILALACSVLSLSACGGAGQGADPRAAQLVAELPAPYSAGDPTRGKSVFALCSACHTTVKGGSNMVGPNLHGLFGAPAGAKSGFAYSDALKASGWTWDATRLDQWVADPQGSLPGNKMVFVGVKDAAQRADLIAYLKVATTP
jgi:cytochrome c